MCPVRRQVVHSVREDKQLRRLWCDSSHLRKFFCNIRDWIPQLEEAELLARAATWATRFSVSILGSSAQKLRVTMAQENSLLFAH
jgi:hypothetical protein